MSDASADTSFARLRKMYSETALPSAPKTLPRSPCHSSSVPSIVWAASDSREVTGRLGTLAAVVCASCCKCCCSSAWKLTFMSAKPTKLRNMKV